MCRTHIPYVIPLNPRVQPARSQHPPQHPPPQSFWDIIVEVFSFVPFVVTLLCLFALSQYIVPCLDYLDCFGWLEWAVEKICEFIRTHQYLVYYETGWGQLDARNMRM